MFSNVGLIVHAPVLYIVSSTMSVHAGYVRTRVGGWQCGKHAHDELHDAPLKEAPDAIDNHLPAAVNELNPAQSTCTGPVART